MKGFDSDAKKSFAQLRDGIDRTIMLHAWNSITECPLCGCDSRIVFGPDTHDEDTYVEIEDCELCNAILQEIAGDIDPRE